MISGFQFYKIYTAIKLHFTTSYNALKYNVDSSKSINRDTYDNRKDVLRMEYWSQKFQTKQHAMEFCIFNFVYNTGDWFYNDFDEANSIYLKIKSFYGALSKNLKDDILYIKNTNTKFSDLINPTKSGNKPPLLQMVLHGNISKEFVCISDDGFINRWMEEYNNDPFISRELNILTKYKLFVNILSDRGKVGQEKT